METWLAILLAVHFTVNICLAWFLTTWIGKAKFWEFILIILVGWAWLLIEWLRDE